MSRYFMKVYRGLFFKPTSVPVDPEIGDLYFDGSDLQICKDGATFDAVGSGGTGTADSVTFPDTNTTLSSGAADGALEFVSDKLFIRMNGAWQQVTTASYAAPTNLVFTPSVLTGEQAAGTVVGSFSATGADSWELVTGGSLFVLGTGGDSDKVKTLDTTGVGTYNFSLGASNAAGTTEVACEVSILAGSPDLLGPELAPSADFSTGWSNFGNPTWTIASGSAHADGSTWGQNAGFETGAFVAGHVYRVALTIADYVQGTVGINTGGGAENLLLPRFTGNGDHTHDFTCAASGAYFFLQSFSGAEEMTGAENPFLGTVTTISIKEVFTPALLCHFDGTGTTISDEFGNPMTAYSGATQTTSQSKFGGSALAVLDAGAYVEASGYGLAPGTGDFTIDMWVYPTAVGTNNPIMDSRPDGGLLFMYQGGDKFNLYNGTDSIPTAGSISSGQWYHLAATRESDTLRFFVNGGLVGSVTDSQTKNGVTYQIGRFENTLDIASNSYVDELRVVIGFAQWTDTFVRPVAPYTP